MNEHIKHTKLIKKSIFKALKWLIGIVGSLLIAALLVLQQPTVQNHLFARLLQHLSHKTAFVATHQHFRLHWLHQATLQGLTIKDPQGHTMLAMDELTLQINPLQLLLHTTIALPTATIKGAQLHLRRGQHTADYNLSTWLDRLTGEAAADSPAPRIQIEKLALQDLTLSVDDQQTPPAQDGSLDWQHCTIHNLHAQLAHLTIRDDAWAADIRQLAGQHADGPLALEHLSASLTLVPGQLQCQTVTIQTAHSTLQGNCTLTYDAAAPPQTWIEQAHITAQLHQATLDAQEIGLIIPYFRQHQATYTLTGQLTGRLPDLHLRDLHLRLGQRNHLHAHAHLKGLPHTQHTHLDVDLKHSTLHTADLQPYLDKEQYALIAPISTIKAKGHIRGTQEDLTAQATLHTNQGTISTNLALHHPLAAQHIQYKGTITTQHLALGTLLHNDAIQTLSAQAEIHGQGLQPATAQAHLKANITHISIKGHNYQNLHAHGHLTNQLFQGQLTINDPHLKLQAATTIDLRNAKNHISIQSTLQQADLQALHLTAAPITLSTHLTASLQGLSLDDTQTDIRLRQLHLSLHNQPIQLEDLTLHISTQHTGQHHILLDSALCTAELKGHFAHATLLDDLHHFVNAYVRRWTHTPHKPHTPQPSTLTYRIHCKNINPLLRIAHPSLYLAPQTTLHGSFTHQPKGTTLTLQIDDAETLSLGQNHWANISAHLTAHQSTDQQNLTATAQITSPTQDWSTGNMTNDFLLALRWDNDTIHIRHTWHDVSQHHHINLSGQAKLHPHNTEITLTPHTLQIAGQPWTVHPDHRIIIGNASTQFNNFQFGNGAQTISIAGTLSSDPATTLHLKIQNLAINNFSQLLNQPLAGQLNATVALRGTLRQPLIDSQLALQNLTVNHTPIGHLQGQTHWNEAHQSLDINFQINHQDQQTLRLKGQYTPTQTNQLHLQAQFAHTPLSTFAPLVNEHITHLAGELNGSLQVQGSLKQPRITGQIKATDATLKVKYLNTHYRFTGTLTGTPQALQLTDLKIVDDQQGTATLHGTLSYQNHQTPHADLKGQLKHFKVIENTTTDDQYLRGKGLMDGTISATGPISNLAIQANVRTAPGTQIALQLQKHTATVEQKDFIHFVKLNTPHHTEDPKPTAPPALKGLQLTLILEITPAAHTQLILNSKTQDTLSGKGQGTLKLDFSSASDLRISGEVTFTEGVCQLSLYHLIKKEFTIQPGSKITWYDDPLQGNLDVRATYEQRVSLAHLWPGDNPSPDIKQKYPVQVHMTLQGVLLTPNLQFDIRLPELPKAPNARDLANTLQEKIKTDESYLSMQVASLIIAKRFYNEKIFQRANNNAQKMLKSSVSEGISQQLNALASHLNENLDIDAEWDLDELGSKGLESLQLNVSYSMLNGRLKVSREGSLSVEAKDKDQAATQLLGNLTVEYALTKDGRFKVRLYNKTITSPTHNAQGKGLPFSGGFSLQYTTSFNRWRELFVRQKDPPQDAAPQ